VCDFGYLRDNIDKSLLNEKWMAFFLIEWSAFPLDGKKNCDGNLGHPEILMQE